MQNRGRRGGRKSALERHAPKNISFLCEKRAKNRVFACTVLSRVCVVARSHKRKFVPQPEDPDVITPKKKKERDTVTRPYKCGFTPEERVD